MSNVFRYGVMLLLCMTIIGFMMPVTASAADIETVFDMKSLGEEKYCRKYNFDCFRGLKLAPNRDAIWVSTDQAVLRFAGKKRDEFRNEQFRAHCDSYNTLAFDAKGTLWIALNCYTPNAEATMAIYDGTSWKLLTPKNFPAPDYARRPRLMAFDQNNIMWSVTYAGLVRYDGKEWKLYTSENSPLPHKDVHALSIDKKGALWVGTDGGHIAKFDGTNWQVFKSGYKSTNGLNSNLSPKSIRFDMNNNMYFTYYTSSKVRKHVAGVFKPMYCSNANADGQHEDIVFDAQNVLWIANFDRNYQNEAGLLRYDGKACKIFKLPNNNSTMIDIDAEGNKWIATYAGHIIVVREGGVK